MISRFFNFLLILNFYSKNSKQKICIFIDFIVLIIKQVILHGSSLTQGKCALFIGHLQNKIFINPIFNKLKVIPRIIENHGGRSNL